MNLFPGCEGVNVMLFALMWCFGTLGIVSMLLWLGFEIDKWLDEED